MTRTHLPLATNRTPSGSHRAVTAAVALLLTLLLAGPALAADIHSNGRGGGRWDDPSTWHSGVVPTADDTVIIAMRDTVQFGLDHSDRNTCAALYLDPEAVLILRTAEDEGRVVLSIGGPAESYGTIRMDATRQPQALVELRFTGSTAEGRQLVLQRNAALLAYGRENLPQRKQNVRITGMPDAAGNRTPARVAAIAGEAMLDLQHLLVTDVAVEGYRIDNTGSKTNQKFNVIGCQFLGHGRVMGYGCDTPTVRDNRFESDGLSVSHYSIHMIQCQLAQLRGNEINGPTGGGIFIQYDTDSTAAGNIIRKANRGIYWHGTNGMLTQNLVEDCSDAVMVHAGSAVMEQVVVVRAANTGFHITKASAQLTTCRLREMGEKAQHVYLDEATLMLLNCDIAHDQIARGKNEPANKAAWVESMQYLVVRLKGNVPEKARVEPRTSEQSGGVPKGKADLNVRNAPANVSYEGLTPLPGSQKALVLKAWDIDNRGRRSNAPFYDLRVIAPDANKQMQVVHSQLIEPTEAWFRAEPDAPVPTLEVTLP